MTQVYYIVQFPAYNTDEEAAAIRALIERGKALVSIYAPDTLAAAIPIPSGQAVTPPSNVVVLPFTGNGHAPAPTVATAPPVNTIPSYPASPFPGAGEVKHVCANPNSKKRRDCRTPGQGDCPGFTSWDNDLRQVWLWNNHPSMPGAWKVNAGGRGPLATWVPVTDRPRLLAQATANAAAKV